MSTPATLVERPAGPAPVAAVRQWTALADRMASWGEEAGFSVRRGSLPYGRSLKGEEPFESPYLSLKRDGRELFVRLSQWDPATETTRVGIDLLPTMDTGAEVSTAGEEWQIAIVGKAGRPLTQESWTAVVRQLESTAERFDVG